MSGGKIGDVLLVGQGDVNCTKDTWMRGRSKSGKNSIRSCLHTKIDWIKRQYFSGNTEYHTVEIVQLNISQLTASESIIVALCFIYIPCVCFRQLCGTIECARIYFHDVIDFVGN